MCGRFQLSVKGKQISERFNIEVFDELYTPNYNCAPSQLLPVITNQHQKILNFFRWGLISSWTLKSNVGYNNIVARSETIAIKPSFKEAFAKRRCIIPANGYYEWKKDINKTPYRIYLENEKIFALAGIWETCKDTKNNTINSFSIITTKANNAVAGIHHRMPVILNNEDEYLWLNENNEELLKHLLVSHKVDGLSCYPISKLVNSVKNNSPGIINKERECQQTIF